MDRETELERKRDELSKLEGIVSGLRSDIKKLEEDRPRDYDILFEDDVELFLYDDESAFRHIEVRTDNEGEFETIFEHRRLRVSVFIERVDIRPDQGLTIDPCTKRAYLHSNLECMAGLVDILEDHPEEGLVVDERGSRNPVLERYEDWVVWQDVHSKAMRLHEFLDGTKKDLSVNDDHYLWPGLVLQELRYVAVDDMSVIGYYISTNGHEIEWYVDKYYFFSTENHFSVIVAPEVSGDAVVFTCETEYVDGGYVPVVVNELCFYKNDPCIVLNTDDNNLDLFMLDDFSLKYVKGYVDRENPIDYHGIRAYNII